MKVEFGKFWILLTVMLFLILFSNIIISDSNPFETNKTCSQTWGGISNTTYCSLTLNDSSPPCNGTATSSNKHVKEVYLNASSIFFEGAINVTCEFKQIGGPTYYGYIWYNNDSSSNTNWIKIWNNSNSGGNYNGSVVFNPNSSEGTHIVRCILSFQNETLGECANDTYTSIYDNDDANFTVTPHLTYSFWNLTNYTNGVNISSGGIYNRNTLINVSAHWNKNISFAQIEHNGTGSWVNYTICSFPNCIGNWTNYTINLSDATKYNQYDIRERYY